jgi:choline dehydrogenase-like flavoprotein
VCPTGAKGDAYERLLAPILGEPNFALRTRLKALRLVERRRGQVSELVCKDLVSGQPERIRARLFVLAANAVQTSALLLRSRSEHSPAGLGNEHDMVGRGLCMKVGQNLTARLSRECARSIPRAGGRWSTVALSDYYLDHRCPTGLGGMIFETGPLDADGRADPLVLRVECLLGDQPLARNRVLADDSVVTMDYRPHPIDLGRLAFVRERATELLVAAGAVDVTAEPLDFTLGSCHFHGTCRMGTNPRTSVCDPAGRLHTADNVVVSDGALMPYPGGVNPTLTSQALAHRVAQDLRAQGVPHDPSAAAA